MQRQQRRRLGAKPLLVPISLYPETLALLNEIARASGDSRARVVRRLVEAEATRVRARGIERAPVWIFPGYQATGGRIPVRIVYRSWEGNERVFDTDSTRVLPEPPIGSYVLVGEGPEQLRGQVEAMEVTMIDGDSSLLITVRGLASPQSSDVHPVLLEYVRKLDNEIRARSNSDIAFDPYRTTPSWKLGTAEVRALLVGIPGCAEMSVRFLPFSGPSFQDHLIPVSDHFPIVAVDDISARERAAEKIISFLERGVSEPIGAAATDAYERFFEAVYILIHAELGGDESQVGAPRRFGDAVFGHGMDYKPRGDAGITQFVVTIARGPTRGRRWSGRYPWRTTPATTVAYDALRAYKRLLDDQ
jgi:hypothetical protein